MRESGYYPPGAEFDPRAPWNEPEDDSQYFLDIEDNEISITRRYNFYAEDEWDEDKEYIDPEMFDLFAAKKLGLNAGEKWGKDEYLEIQEVKDIKRKYDIVGHTFITTWGNFDATLQELINLTHLF